MFWQRLITPILLCESALAQDLLTKLRTEGLDEFADKVERDPRFNTVGSDLVVYAPTNSGVSGPALRRRDDDDDDAARILAELGLSFTNEIAPGRGIPPEDDDASSGDDDRRKFIRDVQTGGSALISYLDDPDYANLPEGRNQSIVEKPSGSGSRPFVYSGLGASVQVVGDDIPFDNGVIRPIDGDLTLPENISSTIPYLGVDSFHGLVKKCGLLSELDSTPGLTLLAPDNNAFKNSSHWSEDELVRLIKRHTLVDFPAYTPLLKDGLVYTTLAGGKVKVSVRDDVVYLNGAKILKGDTIVTNGVVHVIDKLLDTSSISSRPTPVTGAGPALMEALSRKVLASSFVGVVAATRYLHPAIPLEIPAAMRPVPSPQSALQHPGTGAAVSAVRADGAAMHVHWESGEKAKGQGAARAERGHAAHGCGDGQGSEGVAGDLPPLDSIISDAIWSGEEGINWNIQLSHSTQQETDNSSRPFHFLGDGELPDLGPIGGDTPSDDFQNVDARNRMSVEASASPTIPFERLSLDQRPDHSTQLIGFSNESDPFSLQHFPYNNVDEVDFFRVTYRKFSPRTSSRNNGSSEYPPLHFLQSQTGTAIEARRIVDGCMSSNDDREELEKLVDVNTGVALVRLYFKFIFESLPILSRSVVLPDEHAFVMEASTGLLAGIYALALPFTPWDEKLCLPGAYSKPNVDSLWQISYTCLQKELHFPRLSTIQIFLLLLNQMPFDTAVVESPFVWSLASSMLAMSQSLGLNVDPTGWNVPTWEARLRRRLWWAVVVEHTWRSVTHGRSSMLCDDDWDVSPLTQEDFIVDASVGSLNDMSHQLPDYFMHLCSLTQIANSICRQFFSLRAVSRPQLLDSLIEQARGPRQQLLDWLENLPESLQIKQETQEEATDDSVKSHGSLYVAYYTTHILVLRALLRPIINSSTNLDHLQPSVGTVLQASRGLIQTVIKFIRGLDARHQSAFWPAYTRHCLSYPGLFCYMLCLQQREPHMASFDQGLLATWRKTLRTRVQSWPLLRFAIVKVDAIYWKKLH
ncbi:hypothetical protein ACJZ2D_000976 [Fusarium nematophilum]